MKALSLKQPYAELVVSGKKSIELRNWNTKFRGEFFIHSSKIPDKEAMEKFGFKELPLGSIVGEAELVEVKHYSNKAEHDKDKELHLASSDWGDYGFVLKNPKRINPILAKGSLNFWNFDYPNFGN
jgi:hypothetical protein